MCDVRAILRRDDGYVVCHSVDIRLTHTNNWVMQCAIIGRARKLTFLFLLNE